MGKYWNINTTYHMRVCLKSMPDMECPLATILILLEYDFIRRVKPSNTRRVIVGT